MHNSHGSIELFKKKEMCKVMIGGHGRKREKKVG